MSGAEETGTVRRNKRRVLYQRVVGSLGAVVFAWMAIFWNPGPLQTYKADRALKREHAAAEAVRSHTATAPAVQTVVMQRAAEPAKTALQLGPGEKSARIPVPYQMHVEMGGKDYRFHCIYEDGRDIAFLPGEAPCPNGDMPFVYAENLRQEAPNVVTYWYAK